MIEAIPESQRRQRRRVLTDKQVATLPKKRKRYIVVDPEMGGHYVRVPAEGPNVFVCVARDPYKKQVWFTVGSADKMKIREARDEAREVIRRIGKGLPPKEPPPVKPDSFKSVAEDWLQRHVKKGKLRTAYEIERGLRKYVLPAWGSREFTSIRRGHIAKLLDHIEDEHGTRMADLTLSHVRAMAGWYAARHDDYVPPFVARGMKRHKKKPRDRVLSDDELRAVWKEAESKASGTFGALIRLLLLTGQRRAAVVGMRWSDIDANDVWKIPTEEREKGNAGSLKLPKQALAIIHAQPRVKGNVHVVPASRGKGPLAAFSRAKAAFDKRCGVTGWTLHDLRRTARSLMSRAGVSSDHAERVLGHVIEGVEGVYDRHAYLEEKATALAKLAALIDDIVGGESSGKVVRLHGAKP
jgi:integrase